MRRTNRQRCERRLQYFFDRRLLAEVGMGLVPSVRVIFHGDAGEFFFRRSVFVHVAFGQQGKYAGKGDPHRLFVLTFRGTREYLGHSRHVEIGRGRTSLDTADENDVVNAVFEIVDCDSSPIPVPRVHETATSVAVRQLVIPRVIFAERAILFEVDGIDTVNVSFLRGADPEGIRQTMTALGP